MLVPPETPRILQGSHMITTEDRQIELECISTNGKPAAEVIFSSLFQHHNIYTNIMKQKIII